ncbi:MAG: GNAT family N-acetyltransferase [Flavobacteriales bacterium]
MSTQREIYRQADTGSLPLYFQPFWLDVVAPEQWDVRFADSHGASPFVFARKGSRVFMPPFTQFLGPCFQVTDAKYTNRLSRDHEQTARVLDALPSYDSLHLQLGTHVQNMLPYIWKKMSVSPRYSYILPAGKSPGEAFSDFRENIRREIRKAEKQFRVHRASAAEIPALLPHFDLRRTIKDPANIPVLQALIGACYTNEAGYVLVALDSRDLPQAFIFLAHDNSSMYYISGAGTESGKKGGALSMLMWQGIQRALSSGRAFDFEGSMVPSIERFFRAFGSEQKVYFEVRSFPSLLRRFVYWWRILR